MYKKDNILLCLVLFISIYLSTTVKFDKNFDYSSLITFISIITGFQSTSFALIFTSSTVSKLYKEKDHENKQITQKHRLKNYYNYSFLWSIISVTILLLYPEYIKVFYEKYSFKIGKDALIIPIIATNIFIYLKLNSFLYKIFIKEKVK